MGVCCGGGDGRRFGERHGDSWLTEVYYFTLSDDLINRILEHSYCTMNILFIYAYLNVCYVCQEIGRQPGPHLSPDTRGGSLPMRVRLHCRPHCSRRTLYRKEPSEELFSPPTGPRLCGSLDVTVAGAASATGGRGGLSNGRRQGGAPHPVLSRIYPVLSPPFSILLHVDQRPGSTGVAASGSRNKGGG